MYLSIRLQRCQTPHATTSRQLPHSQSQQTLANEFYTIIGKKLQLPKASEPPFKNLGLATSYNGIDVKQTQQCIKISCEDYIDCIAGSHRWTKSNPNKLTSRPTAPLPKNALTQVFKEQGPLEGTVEHKKLQDSAGFSYQTLIGKLFYAYNVCCLDIV